MIAFSKALGTKPSTCFFMPRVDGVEVEPTIQRERAANLIHTGVEEVLGRVLEPPRQAALPPRRGARPARRLGALAPRARVPPARRCVDVSGAFEGSRVGGVAKMSHRHKANG